MTAEERQNFAKDAKLSAARDSRLGSRAGAASSAPTKTPTLKKRAWGTRKNKKNHTGRGLCHAKRRRAAALQRGTSSVLTRLEWGRFGMT